MDQLRNCSFLLFLPKRARRTIFGMREGKAKRGEGRKVPSASSG